MSDLKDEFDAACNPPMLKQPDHPLWPDVRDALMTVFDPDIMTSIYELGLIYAVDFRGNHAHITMTLTTANCPSAQELPAMAQDAVAAVPGIEGTSLNLVWAPQWTREHMSDTARISANLF